MRVATRRWPSSHKRRRNARKLSFGTPVQLPLLTYDVRVPVRAKVTIGMWSSTVRRVLPHSGLVCPPPLLTRSLMYVQSVAFRRRDRVATLRPSPSTGSVWSSFPGTSPTSTRAGILRSAWIYVKIYATRALLPTRAHSAILRYAHFRSRTLCLIFTIQRRGPISSGWFLWFQLKSFSSSESITKPRRT